MSLFLNKNTSSEKSNEDKESDKFNKDELYLK
jgi:hypothetical protein